MCIFLVPECPQRGHSGAKVVSMTPCALCGKCHVHFLRLRVSPEGTLWSEGGVHDTLHAVDQSFI